MKKFQYQTKIIHWILLCIISITLNLIISVTSNTSTLALTYQSPVDLYFNINPTINLTVSGDLTIGGLTPGSSQDSNIINVNVSTNNISGYNLSATVGNSTNTTTNLTHTNHTNTFTSLAPTDSISNLTTDNTWGYSYSTDNGTNWSNYSGLPLYTTTGTTLSEKDSPTEDNIQFKIAAKASNTQISGDYTNTINFYAVANPAPPKIMQYIESWKSELANVGDEVQAIDLRDGNTYWVAKLPDGNIWMTQNLDLCIGCTGTTTLDSTNTDLNTSGSGAYITDYTTSGGVITWTPTASTMTGNPATITYPESDYTGSVNGWTNNWTTPYIAEGNDERVVQGNRFTDKSACMTEYDATTCDHDHVGNYYNWTAAVASSASSAIGSTRYETATNSICPKGWRLPQGPNGTNGSEFETMLKVAGIANPNNTDNGSGSPVNVGYGTLSSTDMEKSPYYFARSGFVSGTTLYNFTSRGDYWSGSVVSSSDAFSLYYYSSALYPANQYGRNDGRSLRCLAK